MGLLTGIKIKSFLKRVGLGIVDSIPVASTIKNNIEADTNKPGKIDWLRLAVSIILITAFLAFAFGKITFEDFKNVVKLLK